MKNENVSLQQLLNLFCHEEFMRRLSVSNYRDNLILKGNLFLYYISGVSTSLTVDADYLLKTYSNDLAFIEKLVKEVISLPYNDDSVVFEIDSLEIIDEYKGNNIIKANLIGIIEGVSTPISINFGMGDIIVPSPVKRTLPVLINKFEKPVILTYSLESTVSEKLNAIISSIDNSGNMKDFYELYYLASTFDFDGRKLQEAMYETLSNRGTPYEKESITDVSRLAKDIEIKSSWDSFCRKTLKNELDFTEALNKIIEFILPPYMSMIKEDEFFKTWSYEEGKYI